MPVKKKVNFDNSKNTKNAENTENDDNIDNTEDDQKSVSTDSDIISGTFSQLDETEEVAGSDIESVESDITDIEDEIIVDENEDNELEIVAEEEIEEKVKTKKKKPAKKTVNVNSDCLYNNIDFEEDYEEKEEQVEDSKRITINRMSKYEKVRIIGIRAKQIMTGANILIKGVENKTPTEIAELELINNMVPFKIKRRLPNGRYEIWKLSELEK